MSFQMLKNEIIDVGLCQGCGLCVGLCKHIDMVDLRPNLKDFCIVARNGLACGKCYNSCPQVRKKQFKKEAPIDFYALQTSDPSILSNAASGGFVSTLSKYLLENEKISHLVSVRNIDETAKAVVILKSEEIIENAGVVYGRSGLLEKMIQVLGKEHDKIAIVGVPCEINAVAEVENEMKADILKIGLFCNASFRTQETDMGIISSPCASNCPAGVNAAGYIELIKLGRFQEAVDLIRQKNPFPSVCGRICTHECEFGCSLHQSSNPLAVRELKKFVTEWEMKNQKKVNKKPTNQNGKKIAIIGSGPAGLTAAYYCAKLGYKPVIFERADKTGGMLRLGVPQFRLPDDVLQHDIDFIKDAGVEIKTKVRFGEDITLKTLRDQGYEAIFLAIGQYKPLLLGIENENLKNIETALNFLVKYKYNFDQAEEKFKGKVVGVIGGGSVALDTAQTAIRLGAKRVIVFYRRGEKELPARREDYENSLEEGVEFHFLRNPSKFIGDKDGKLKAIELIKMKLGELDKSKRRSPIPIENSEYTMDIDYVVVAIGQTVDESFLDLSESKELKKNRGKITIDRITFQTNISGVFAGGDIIEKGKNIAVTAIAQGREAAYSIDRYLKGEDLYKGRIERKGLFYQGPIKVPEKIPPQPPKEKKEDYWMNFTEIDGVFNKELAVEEAKRCLNCNSYCSHCQDFAAQYADLSAGDIGSDKKFTTVLTWTRKGERIVQDLMKKKLVKRGVVSVEAVNLAISEKMKREILKFSENPRDNVYQWVRLHGPSTIPEMSEKLDLPVKDIRYNALRLTQTKKFSMEIIDGNPVFSKMVEE
ncbi:MAG: FAD-dependent oxidoreductase [Promethearchaeota archaeon]